jgi:hypothetical protein
MDLHPRTGNRRECKKCAKNQPGRLSLVSWGIAHVATPYCKKTLQSLQSDNIIPYFSKYSPRKCLIFDMMMNNPVNPV